MTSKERALLRAQANTIDTTLIVGKSGISDEVIAEAEKLLDGKELVKGKVLESAMLSAREASDAICERTGAEGVQTVGSKFVIWRKSERLEKEKMTAPKALKTTAKKKVNPVKLGIKTRKQEAKAARERKKKYYHEAAVQAAIDRRKENAQ